MKTECKCRSLPLEWRRALLGKNMKTLSSRSIRRMLGFFVLCLCPLFPVQAQQSPNPPTNQDEVNQQLLRRLQELEDEVKQLKAQPVAAAAAAPAPEPPPAVEMPSVNEIAPRLKLNVFGDVGWQ